MTHRGRAAVALPPCFHLADSVFPRVRAEAARRLAGDGWSQSRIAALLGVSQAMVSKYQARAEAEADVLVLRLSDDLLAGLDALAAAGPSVWCRTLSVTTGRAGAEAALEDLLAAETRLVQAAPLWVMPQVGLNIARALPEAKSPGDVLAYPARIAAAGDRLVRPEAPELGASRHLAACLLELRRRDPSLHALANIRGGEHIAAAAGPHVRLAPEGDRETAFAQAVGDAADVPHTLHDPGAIGIEPCLYIAAPDAHQVVARILDIAQKVRP